MPKIFEQNNLIINYWTHLANKVVYLLDRDQQTDDEAGSIVVKTAEKGPHRDSNPPQPHEQRQKSAFFQI
ncbi:Mitogen-activated protein kinase kinase kinase mom-4 [Frankliniella fusca]|uniref:Mitogen-activated protein kinase kinase kinase mom-4 n=1 Tax=Frankliniella fusca TaxID=407009 RepID=A0AAE1HTK3_9NEOP|nr:Mitogen-activated protein kinase kinase kinase mom-4 [Frankliniella fusca]